jgi:hypothetical protein
VQRWLCRRCGRRFSEASAAEEPIQDFSEGTLKIPVSPSSSVQICASEGEAKNLVNASTPTIVIEKRDGVPYSDKISECEFYMQKKGLAECTVRSRCKMLKRFVKLGADLYTMKASKLSLQG